MLERRGGFPTPAVHLRKAADRAVWFDGYVCALYLEQDLRDLSAVALLPDFRRLMRAACFTLHTGRTLAWIAPGVLAAPWWRVM